MPSARSHSSGTFLIAWIHTDAAEARRENNLSLEAVRALAAGVEALTALHFLDLRFCLACFIVICVSDGVLFLESKAHHQILGA